MNQRENNPINQAKCMVILNMLRSRHHVFLRGNVLIRHQLRESGREWWGKKSIHLGDCCCYCCTDGCCCCIHVFIQVPGWHWERGVVSYGEPDGAALSFSFSRSLAGRHSPAELFSQSHGCCSTGGALAATSPLCSSSPMHGQTERQAGHCWHSLPIMHQSSGMGGGGGVAAAECISIYQPLLWCEWLFGLCFGTSPPCTLSRACDTGGRRLSEDCRGMLGYGAAGVQLQHSGLDVRKASSQAKSPENTTLGHIGFKLALPQKPGSAENRKERERERGEGEKEREGRRGRRMHHDTHPSLCCLLAKSTPCPPTNYTGKMFFQGKKNLPSLLCKSPVNDLAEAMTLGQPAPLHPLLFILYHLQESYPLKVAYRNTAYSELDFEIIVLFKRKEKGKKKYPQKDICLTPVCSWWKKDKIYSVVYSQEWNILWRICWRIYSKFLRNAFYHLHRLPHSDTLLYLYLVTITS